MTDYFQTLVEELVQEILRQLSNRPNRLDWYAFIEPKVVSKALQGNEVLAKATASLFTSSITAHAARLHLDVCNSTVPCNCFSSTSAPSQYADGNFPTVMQLSGSSASDITFTPYLKFYASFANAVVAHGSGIKSLTFNNPYYMVEIESVLKHHGTQLRKLRINYIDFRIASSISNNCTALSHLSLVDGTQHFPLVLNAVGTTLLSLDIQSSVDNAGFDLIQNSCPHLREMRTWCVPASYESLVNLCRFYGEQLEFASLHQMSASQVRRIIENCPHVRVQMGSIRDFISTLRALSTHIEEIGLSFVHYIDTSQLSNALARCDSLNSLRLDGIEKAEDDVLLKMFTHGSCCQLEELWLQSGIEIRSSEITAIASATSLLRKVSFTVNCDVLEPDELQVLLKNNPRLEKVELVLLNFKPDDERKDKLIVPDENGDKFLFGLLGVLSKAQSLCELVILPCPYKTIHGWWDYLYCVDDACMEFGFRNRRIHVSVFDIEYL